MAIQFNSEIASISEGSVRYRGVSPKPGALEVDYAGFWRNQCFGFYDEIGAYLLTV